MPCHDSPTAIKARPAATCTRESPIMHRDGQGRAGQDRASGTACGRHSGTGQRDQGQRGRGGTAEDGTADPTDSRLSAIIEHGPPPHGSPPDLLLAMTG